MKEEFIRKKRKCNEGDTITPLLGMLNVIVMRLKKAF